MSNHSHLPRMNIQDLTGQKFGLLTVLKFSHINKNGKSSWICECDCGNISIVQRDNLIRGNTKSCGCFQKINRFVHGMSDSPIYHIWSQMLQRCENPNNRQFKDYGGRGITVCQRWHKFENFYEDVGEKPEGKSLDRWPNNDGNYEPSNWRWATSKEQRNNTRPLSHGPGKQKCFFACNWRNMQVYSSDNQHQFARDHDLDQSKISAHLHSKKGMHKGWTFAYAPQSA